MIATTIEQSKRLLELGLDPNTADMYYTGHRSIYNPKEIEYTQVPRVRTKFVSFDRLEIFFPAWSLSALLEVMYDYEPNLYKDGKWTLHVLTEFSSHYTHGYETLDAAYEMVCWLLKNGYIKKGD